MLIAALAVGLLTAYYFGVRPGLVAGGATAALFVIAMVAPVVALYAYVVVGVGVAGLLFAGPRLRRKSSPSQLAFFTRMGVARFRRALRELGGSRAKGSDSERDRKRRPR